MYENEFTIFTIVWVIIILVYLEGCRRNRGKWILDPIDALMIWFGVGFGATAILTWVNGYVQATMGNLGMSVMFFIVIPILLRLFSQRPKVKRE